MCYCKAWLLAKPQNLHTNMSDSDMSIYLTGKGTVQTGVSVFCAHCCTTSYWVYLWKKSKDLMQTKHTPSFSRQYICTKLNVDFLMCSSLCVCPGSGCGSQRAVQDEEVCESYLHVWARWVLTTLHHHSRSPASSALLKEQCCMIQILWTILTCQHWRKELICSKTRCLCLTFWVSFRRRLLVGVQWAEYFYIFI